MVGTVVRGAGKDDCSAGGQDCCFETILTSMFYSDMSQYLGSGPHLNMGNAQKELLKSQT